MTEEPLKPIKERAAEELIHVYGEFAHMHTLETILSRKDEDSRQWWRDVLTNIDKILNERKQNDNV